MSVVSFANTRNKNRQQGRSTSIPGWLLLAMALTAIFCCTLRFVNLDCKFFWMDEADTAFVACGHRTSDFQNWHFYGRVFSAREVKSHLQLKPKTSIASVLNVRAKDAKQTPLYFVLTNLWGCWHGFDLYSIRLLPVLISLCCLPALYLLCLELFGSTSIAAFATTLAAVSPLHFTYAQEARPYSLWTLTTILSSLLLLRALRLKSSAAWLCYAGTLTIGFYSYLLAIVVTAWQTVFVISQRRSEGLRAVFSQLGAVALAALLFAPWIVALYRNWYLTTCSFLWVEQKISTLDYLRRSLVSLGQIFLDLNLPTTAPLAILIGLIVLILSVSAFTLMWRTCSRRTFLFVLLLTISTALPLLSQDMTAGGMRAVVPRYLLPSYLGVEIAIAYLLERKIASASSRGKPIWISITALIFFAGTVSCIVSSSPSGWSNKVEAVEMTQLARRINQVESPLLLIDRRWCTSTERVLTLSALLSDKVDMVIIDSGSKPLLPERYKQTFVLASPDHNIAALLGTGHYTLSCDTNGSGVLWTAQLNRNVRHEPLPTLP